MRYLKTNTATIVTVGPFIDVAGLVLETALTITNERISLTVDLNDGSAPTLVLDNVTGATSGTANDLNYITNCDAGLMQLELAAANVNYVGRAFLTITDAANHCPVFHEFTILPAQVYDSLILGTDLLQADTTQIGGTAQTARDLGASVLLSSGTGTGQLSITSGVVAANATQISGDATAADNAEAFFDGTGYAGTNNVIPLVTTTTTATNLTNLPAAAATAAELAKVPKSDSNVTWNATALAAINAEVDTALNTAIPGGPTANSVNERVAAMDDKLLGTVAAGTHTAQSGDSYARLGAPAGASVSADVLQVKNYVDDIGAAGAGLTALPWNAAWDAEVQSEAQDAITASALATAAALATIDDFLDTEIAAILADTNELQTDWVNGGRLDLILDIIAADTTTDIPALIADVPTVAEFEARTLVAADYVVVGDTLAAVTTVGSVTGAVGSVAANGITATSIAADAINAAAVKADAVTKIQNGLATPTNITAGTITTVTNLTNAPTNGDLTATMKASVNTEVDTALNTAIPGSPTADSINERVATMDTGVNVTQISGDSTAADRLEAILDATPSGAVVDDNDPDPSATAFETNLTESTNDHYNGTFVLFYSGALLGQSRKVSDYDGTSKVLTVAAAFTEAPAAGDTFIILGRSE